MPNIDLYFDPAELDAYIWIIVGVLGVAFIIQLFYYIYYYTGILSQEKKKKRAELPYLQTTPGVSVIICAKNESENLREFLPVVLNQKYPDFEVIVVNDGSTDETDQLLIDLKRQYSNLYNTYVPEDVKVMSSKKLALTIGIKAAHNDLILLTDADCKPVSENWISLMVRNFTDKKDFVLGYGAYEKKKGLLGHLISYDTFFIALQYMGFAIRGVPYMGVGRNMAYRSKIFFDNRGFASILHLQSGDDDLFVNNNTNRINTRVETDSDSKTISEPKESFSEWYYQKERHLSTSSFYTSKSQALIGTEVGSRGLFYLAIVLTIIFAPAMLKIIAGGVWLIRLITQMIIINRTANILAERHFYLSIIFFDILLPLISLKGLISNKFHKKRIYKWK
ncbi:MAG: glycosyltransferase [Paludibacteraceae bacterium]|nr:glycosyltransferase [Paludibacteraceae bacterium]MBP5742982.1 glycosyltransferase [Paludibacteraceae bacterium]